MGQAVPLDDLPGALVPESDLPDEQKKRMGATGPVAPDSGFMDEVKGAAQIVAVPVAGVANYVLENPVHSAASAYGAYKGRQLVNSGIDYLRNSAGAPGIDTGAKVDLRSQMQSGTSARNIPINTPAAGSTPGSNVVRGPWAGTQPVAPTAPAPQAAPQPGIMDRASQVVRQLALDKLAKVGVGAAAALTPGNIGQNYPFPQTGPLRGSEINPNTGAPWTKQELDAYRAQYGG